MVHECLSAEDKREVLDKVLKSKGFQRAAKLRDFLRYVCERAIESGDGALVREQEIGRAVYHRPDDYNPSEDNIVRVEARNLRRKLDEFFGEGGQGSALPVVIRIPRGGYIPEFERREPGPEPHPLPLEASPQPAANPARTRHFLGVMWGIGALALLSTLAAAFLLLKNRELTSRVPATAEPAASFPIWSALFDDRHDTWVVLADSGFVMLQDLLRRDLSLSDYLQNAARPMGPEGEAARAAGIVTSTTLTSMTGARFAASLFQLPGVPRDRVSIRSARELQPRDLKGRHLILVGSVRSNPWVELFQPRLNFRYEFDFAQSRAVIRNLKPLPGEAALYETGGQDGNSAEIWSTLAFLPNLSKDGNVLLVAGTRQGTESAIELLMNPSLLAKIAARTKIQERGRVRYFEMLIRSASLGTTTNGMDVVAWRVLPE